MPKKIAKCSNCGLVKTIYAYGLCSPCYLYQRRHGIPRPFKKLKCPQCGIPFFPNRIDAKFCSEKCQKKHGKRNETKVYLGIFGCPICYQFGRFIAHYYKKTFYGVQVQHGWDKNRFSCWF
jgi:predicted nucleic acid-binding Zn ribbon protein